MNRPTAIARVYKRNRLPRLGWFTDCSCGYMRKTRHWRDAMADAERHIRARHTEDTTSDVIG